MDAHLSPDNHFDPTQAKSKSAAKSRVTKFIIGIAAASLVIMVAIPVFRMRAENSRCKQCEANLTRLGLAFHKYHNAHGQFPAPEVSRADGTPLLSWRVALLPDLGYRPLYERFHLDEPWDSPHNRSLLAEMPAELACPGVAVPRRDGSTGYMVVIGAEHRPAERQQHHI